MSPSDSLRSSLGLRTSKLHSRLSLQQHRCLQPTLVHLQQNHESNDRLHTLCRDLGGHSRSLGGCSSAVACSAALVCAAPVQLGLPSFALEAL